MNNIQRADVTLLHGLEVTKLHFARHTQQEPEWQFLQVRIRQLK